MQLTVDPAANQLRALSEDGAWAQDLSFEDGIRVADLEQPHSVILFPGSPAPAFEVMLVAGDGERLGIRVDVLTGVPEDWSANPEAGR